MTTRTGCRWPRRAGIAAAAVLGISGAALAEVPDGRWTIVDDKAPDTRAELELAGATYAVEIVGICEEFLDKDSADGSEIRVATGHPDRIALRKDKGEVEQSRKDNAVAVTFVTGSGEQRVSNQLVCERADAEADVKTKKSPNQGSFEARGKDCSCPDLEGNDCSVFVEQIGTLATNCQRNKSVDVRFSDKNQNLRKFQAKGNGEATPKAVEF